MGAVTEGLTAAELKRLRDLTRALAGLRDRLRRFAEKLPPAHPEAPRGIVRDTVDCVLHDRITLAIQQLEQAAAEAAGETVGEAAP